jgi:tetratricopeptide (TPR) repeat protein
MADIFVSYTSSDSQWAFWIAKELKTLGHVPHIHEWEIKGSDDIYGWMEQHHDVADHVLCVISDDYLDYLKAPYSTLERHAALWQAAKKRTGFVLLVVVKPCKLPTLSDHLRRCELFGVPEDAARLRFREFMSKRGAPTDVAFPGKVFAVSNIPIREPERFMGRDDTLAEIETKLTRNEGRVAITALHGLRGVGKTTLAAVYAERHRSDYRATWWIRAETEAGLRADLVALGIRLGWVGADDKEEPAVEAVMERLRHEGEGILLIFDNAADAKALNPYLPRGGGVRVLVTSNAHAWRGEAAPVEIAVWSKNIGADYLIARTGREAERTAAENLSEALGGLPLAHEQAAAYCERLDISLADYCKRCEAAPVRFLDDARHAPGAYHDGRSVAKTFALAIEEAAKHHPAAEPLIVYAALLAPEPIPLFLFAEAREKFGEPLASALAGEGLDEAVAALRTFALVDRETIADASDAAVTTDVIRLHRLVREVAAMRREGEPQNQMRHILVTALASVYPNNAYRNPASWPRCAPLTPHVLAICETEMTDATANAQYAGLLNNAGSYFHSRGAYSTARPLFEQALAICEKVLGPEHPVTAASLNNLAGLLQDEGGFVKARSLLERALEINEKAYGPQDPTTARSLHSLARLLYAQGDRMGARRLSERALAIREKVLGPEHPETAFSLDILANVLQDQGDFAGARPLYERALAITEKVLGPEHPETATNLNNLASLLCAQGDLAGALTLYKGALEIAEKVLGPEHPETAGALNNVASVLQAQGDLAGALALYKRALEIAEKVLGSEHPDTARALGNLASVLQAQGDLAGALTFYKGALEIAEKVLGPEHPETARALGNLSLLLYNQGDLKEAQVLLERALAIREKALGLDHLDTATSLNSLASVLYAQGDLVRARPLFERASVIREKALGPDHIHTALSRANLAGLLETLGDLEGALPLFERALAIYEKVLGPEHPHTNRARAVLRARRRGDEVKAGEGHDGSVE